MRPGWREKPKPSFTCPPPRSQPCPPSPQERSQEGGLQLGSACRAPRQLATETSLPGVPFRGVDLAALDLEVLANDPGDESDPLSRGATVSGDIGGAPGDDLALVELLHLEAAVVIEITSSPDTGEMPGRNKVELDAPLVVALPEGEGMALDTAAPLLRFPTAVAGHDDIGMADQPRHQFVFLGFTGGLLGPPVGGLPKGVHRRHRRPPGRRALFRTELAGAGKPVSVEVGIRQAGMARAQTVVVTVPSSSDEQVIDDGFGAANTIVRRYTEAGQHTSEVLDVEAPALAALAVPLLSPVVADISERDDVQVWFVEHVRSVLVRLHPRLTPHAARDKRFRQGDLVVSFSVSAKVGSVDTPALIKEALEAAACSRAELARRAGIPQSVLSAYEHGRREPAVSSLNAVLGAVGLELAARSKLRVVDDKRAERELLDVLSFVDGLPFSPRPAPLAYPRFPR